MSRRFQRFSRRRPIQIQILNESAHPASTGPIVNVEIRMREELLNN